MSGVVTVSRALTPRNWTATTDPTNAFDAADGVRVGDHWYNTTSGNVWVCTDNTVGAAKWRHIPRVLGQTHTSASHTGSATETILGSFLVPAGAMGTNGRISIHSNWTHTSSGSTKTARIRFGTGNNTSGTQLRGLALSASLTYSDLTAIGNITASTQTSTFSDGAPGGISTAGAATTTSSIDTTAATYVVLSGALASTGETVTLIGYSAILYRPDIT